MSCRLQAEQARAEARSWPHPEQRTKACQGKLSAGINVSKNETFRGLQALLVVLAFTQNFHDAIVSEFRKNMKNIETTKSLKCR
jgi:hypothetical protein